MPAFQRLATLERALQLGIAATVVTTVLAAGSLLEWIPTARTGRWLALAALAALTASYAVARRGRPDRVVLGAAAFAAFAGLSAAWSAAPRLSSGHAAAFGLVVFTAACLSAAAAGQPELVERILGGVLLAGVAVAVGGLLVLAFRYDRAVQPATTVSPARYQGLGGGPNMASMVLALAVPLAAHALAVARGLVARGAAAAAGTLLLASIAFSGSRGAMAAAAAGLLAYVLLAAPSRRAVSLGVAAAAIAAMVLLSLAPSTAATNPPRPTGVDPAPAQVEPAPGYLDANLQGPRLQDDIGHPGAGVADTRRRERTLLGSSGRTEAWRGAVELALERPLLGYGFGTEDRTFVDRYVFFNSNVPENSYIGLALQLGLVGLAAFLLLAALLLRRAAAAAARSTAAACAAVLVAGLTLGLFQSYVYAAGNGATLPLWIAALLAVAASPAEVDRA